MTIVLTVLLGLVYPLVVTGVAQVAFHDKANGSLVKANGKVVGSSLIGQNFTDKDGNPLPQYFQPRPSAAGDGYDAAGERRLQPRPVEPDPHRQPVDPDRRPATSLVRHRQDGNAYRPTATPYESRRHRCPHAASARLPRAQRPGRRRARCRSTR